MKRVRITPFAWAALAMLLAPGLSAAIGQALLGTAFTYQGQLKDAGQPFNGSANLIFRLYDASVGGNLIGSQTLTGVGIAGGLFTVVLNGSGEFGPIAFNGDARWLDITVNGTTLTPRQPLTAAPYALYAQSVPNPLEVDGTTNNWQIGAQNYSTDPGATGVLGVIATTLAHSSSVAVRGENHGTGSGIGVWGSHYGSGWGVLGTSVSGDGVHGQSDGGTGRGVYGLVTATPAGGDENFGVFGEATAASGDTYGLWGESASTAGTGALGCASATTGFNWGVVGLSFSTGGTGVYGSARAFSGTTYGVWGTALSDAGYGVYGSVSGGTQNAGVYGNSTALDGNGIIGEALNGGSAFGLWAKAPQATGVYCQGALTVTGNKSFRIDHPFDPENRYLIHYCSEGPEPLNIYRGNALLDDTGQAWITLPAYFAEINRDPSYQLTAIGPAAPNLRIAQEIVGNRFLIAGGNPGQKVSWRVEAVRHDLYVRHYGAPVEAEKSEKERGTYQHPELYGLGPERMLGYQPPTRPADRPQHPTMMGSDAAR